MDKPKKTSQKKTNQIVSQCQVRDKPAIEVPIVIPGVGNTVPLRFITDCSGQSGEIEPRASLRSGVIFRVAVVVVLLVVLLVVVVQAGSY